jgi:hypothetical protein
MNDELEWIWQEVVPAYFKVLSWHLPGGTKKNVKDLSLQYTVNIKWVTEKGAYTF